MWRAVARSDPARADTSRVLPSFRHPTELLPHSNLPDRLEMNLSGFERNVLLLNDGRAGFSDVSTLSGLDDVGDSRVSALLDYDRDGWPDVALTNANAPRLNLYRNQIGEQEAAAARRVVAVRLVGGNHSGSPSSEWSNRDAVGAVLRLTVGDRVLVRERRLGEGLSGQNSATLLIGIGTADAAELEVRWPSGREQQVSGLEAGQLVTVYEDPASSPGGAGFVREDYRRAVVAPVSGAAGRILDLPFPVHDGAACAPRLRLVTTMASWCVACKAEVPELRALRAAFSHEELCLAGVAVDPNDDEALLEGFLEEYQPPYDLLPVDHSSAARVRAVGLELVGQEVLPTSLVLDAEGHILAARAGRPFTVSELRALLD
jgi:thiol-disulfide isomerase/thioredoxin